MTSAQHNRARRALRMAALGCLLAAAILIGWSFVPLAGWTPPMPTEANTIRPSEPEALIPPPDALARTWARSLRSPLQDAAPQAAPAVAAPSIELVGTVIEPDRAYALVKRSDGRTVIVAAGETINGLQVLAVERGLVRLLAGATEHQVRVPYYNRLTKVDGSQ